MLDVELKNFGIPSDASQLTADRYAATAYDSAITGTKFNVIIAVTLRTIARNLILLLGVVALTDCIVGASQISQIAGEAPPSWSVSLDRIDSFEHFLHSPVMIPPEVAFISNDRLAISFLNPCAEVPIEQSLRLKKREEQKMPCALTLSVLLVDTKNGDVVRTLTLSFHTVHQTEPSSPPGQGLRLLIPARDGEFLIHTGDFLLRYGADLEVIEKRPIGNPDRTVVFVSPGGTRVLVNEYEDVNKFRKMLCPGDHIQAGELFGEGWPGEGVTDDGKILSFVLSGNLLRPQSSDYRRVKIGREKCPSRRGLGACLGLCAAEDDCAVLGGYGWLADNNRFAMKRGAKNFVIVDRSGKVVYQGRAADFIYDFVAGPDSARRLVVRSGKMGASNGEMVWKFVFDVLNLNDMTSDLKVTLRGSGGTKLRTPDAAISPDGNEIAVLVGSRLHLYRVQAKTQ
jgi:hypothetical protein